MTFETDIKIAVTVNNLASVVKTRLLGINDAIRGLRKRKPKTVDESLFIKDSLALLKEARNKTNIILNKLIIILKKESFDEVSIRALKEEFMKMTIDKPDKDHGP